MSNSEDQFRALLDQVAAHLSAAHGQRMRGESQPSKELVKAVSTLLLSGQYDPAERLLQRRFENRPNFAVIADYLLAEVARDMGARWDRDEISFAQVAVVIESLYRLRRALRAEGAAALTTASRRKAIFAGLQDQVHVLGLVLAGEAFEQDGWKVDIILNATPEDIIERAARWRPDIIGLTAGRAQTLPRIEALASEVKRLPFFGLIILGGYAANAAPKVVRDPAIDLVVSDIQAALKFAHDHPPKTTH